MLGKFKGEKRSLYSRLINENGGAGACLAGTVIRSYPPKQRSIR